ncbi:MAG: hypothetical protein M0Q53_00040 [Prolixibacteraceae bacterium]|jgi:hypothetical protein|nr:hypothetical protein [Prolixibacteraceae bacterium]
MEIIEVHIGNWFVRCIPEDGARISVLRYEGQDLLTANPPSFSTPEKFYGEYETRPVYGYDDCFPTVDPCVFSDNPIGYRDHGELCWLEWQVQVKGNSLICSIDCPHPGASFKRILEFSGNKLTWKFELINTSGSKLAFLHVMHALFPLDQIKSVQIPAFSGCVDDIHTLDLNMKYPQQVANHLLEIQSGSYEMLLLKEIGAGLVALGFQDDFNLQISFDNELFPTLGIWWNNAGYPDEEGLRRSECAFEPIPGTCSNLSHSFDNGVCLMLEAGQSMNWEINWEIQKR